MSCDKFIIEDEHQAGMRLDVFLTERQAYPSRSSVQKAILDNKIRVNGNQVSKNYRMRTHDVIEYELVETHTMPSLQAEDIPLAIIFEDEDLMVLSKQAGLVCHPGADHDKGTLVNALINHCGIDNLCDIQDDPSRRGIVHRLDKDTSGLMLVAKNNTTAQSLMHEIKTREVDRHYLALVYGIIEEDKGLIDAPLSRHPSNRKRFAVHPIPQAREAKTSFQVLKRYPPQDKDRGYSLLDCKLFTGRTHQIRVHLEYIHHPVVGDGVYTTYAPKAPETKRGLERQFLHSYRLCFTHPRTLERFEFKDELPPDLAAVLSTLDQERL